MIDTCEEAIAEISCAFNEYEKKTTAKQRKAGIPYLEQAVERLKEGSLDVTPIICILESHIKKYKKEQ